MRTRAYIIGGSVLIAGVAGWALFRPELLFIDTRVNEALPVTVVSEPAGARETGAVARPPQSGARASEARPVAVTLARGEFHGVAHEGRGTASIHRLTDGSRVLRFTDFATSNGPDVRVYLVAVEDAHDNETVRKAGFFELGVLKGNVGDQNYAVPAHIDLATYRAVTIWCKRFSVNFATAPLHPAPPTAAGTLVPGPAPGELTNIQG
jgi:hypothetical protein